MTVKITYFVHGTTTDNERKLATGWAPGELSELGVKQSKELKDQVDVHGFDVVFCSDLKRAVDSAGLTFGGEVPIKQDRRLRECNYGDLTRKPSGEVKADMPGHVEEPYPNGESYRDVERRIRDFLDHLSRDYQGRRVAIVAHQAPQLALEVVLKGRTWEQAIAGDWRRRGEWQPGWEYVLE